MFQIVELLLVFQLLQSSDGRLDCDSRSGAGKKNKRGSNIINHVST